MLKELPKTYSPAEFEDRIYKRWCEKGYFTPKAKDNKPPFSIVIPPPNVTGQLHMGHALNNTLQDVIVRTKRMQGYDVLWVPGTDHAGIATQIKVEQMLREEKGLSRHDLGREAFLELVWEWRRKYGGTIINQLKKLGSSCDWTRERFTMDDMLSFAVKKVFLDLYNKGLIYRGLRIINWCPDCVTALSDAEVEHKESEGHFWHIKYPIKDSDEFVIVATTRPETMLGDTAVAVHPEDERYTHLVGKTLILPLVGREIPVIADEMVLREFGTGCVKITPAHDPNDFETGQRHNLENIIVIDDKGRINERGGEYFGLDRYEARKKIVADLEANGFLVKTEACSHNVAHCYRCSTIIEPIASKQWFVKMKPLAEPAIAAVKEGIISYIPDRFSKIYLNWMENIRDWCISRQLWWGHRIPAFYCDDCGEVIVSEDPVTTCPKCHSDNVHQDEDVLDTWFSSALWPFSTLGWPEKTDDLERYYPTSVLVTAYDIITFWVSKMIVMGLEFMEQKPFPDVFIHGLIRDAQGRKMSKSLGNGIDPLELIDKYGADALRFALATGNSPGNDMRFSDEKIEAARNFVNKLWNAARFVLMNLDIEGYDLADAGELALEDKWILSRFNELSLSVNNCLDKYELGIALSNIYDFVWDVYCDWYIELCKTRLSDKGTPQNRTAQIVLAYVLDGILKLLHPYIPFVTEEIFLSLPNEEESIMISRFPTYDPALSFPAEEEEMERIIGAIRAIRARRAEMNIPPSRKANLFIVTKFPDTFGEKAAAFFGRLASASSIQVVDDYTRDDAVQIVTDAATIYIPLSDMVDLELERKRLQGELEKTTAEIERLSKKLSNTGFITKAPPAVVEGEREKLAKYEDTLQALKEAIQKLDV
ncbi:MAG: valine--tRNA ligase [Clostridiales bacterium]|nr:valine--tRNA ligase [Clostridiales bacterium]